MARHRIGLQPIHLPLATVLVTVLALSALLVGGARPVAANGSAPISSALSSWMANATEDATTPAVITFHDRSGLARLDAAKTTVTPAS